MKASRCSVATRRATVRSSRWRCFPTRGALLAGPTSLGRSSKSVLWVEAITERARRDRAVGLERRRARRNLERGSDAQSRALRAPARLLARDVGAWQAVSFGKGIALAVTHVGKGNTHGPIELSLLNGSGRAARRS